MNFECFFQRSNTAFTWVKDLSASPTRRSIKQAHYWVLYQYGLCQHCSGLHTLYPIISLYCKFDMCVFQSVCLHAQSNSDSIFLNAK